MYLVPEVGTDTDGCSVTGEDGGEHVTRAEHGGHLLGDRGWLGVDRRPGGQPGQRAVGAGASRVQVGPGRLLRLAGPRRHVDGRQLCVHRATHHQLEKNCPRSRSTHRVSLAHDLDLDL